MSTTSQLAVRLWRMRESVPPNMQKQMHFNHRGTKKYKVKCRAHREKYKGNYSTKVRAWRFEFTNFRKCMIQDILIPSSVVEFCQHEKFGNIVVIEVLKGGAVSLSRRLTTDSGKTLILKQCTDSPPDMYASEAESLRTLQISGLHTPDVLLVAENFLLVEDLGTASRDHLDWEALGQAIAQLHQHRHPKFGFNHDNYLGMPAQYNPWTEDGYAFFGKYRVMRFLEVPLVQQTLTKGDRANLERLVSHLPQLIPMQPPSLLHGDLWYENILLCADGRAAVVDPAVYYGWPEAELAMAQQYPGIPRVFFEAYVEVNPLEHGWWERLEILYIREILSVIAHFGGRGNALAHLRTIMTKFA